MPIVRSQVYKHALVPYIAQSAFFESLSRNEHHETNKFWVNDVKRGEVTLTLATEIMLRAQFMIDASHSSQLQEFTTLTAVLDRCQIEGTNFSKNPRY